MPTKSTDAKAAASPEAQLRSLIGDFSPKDQKLVASVRSAVRKRFPSANELVYDYGTHLVFGYSPTENGVDGILTIAAHAGDVRLYLMNGPQLPDPKKLLIGSGKQVRYIEVPAASRLKHPDVEALIAASTRLTKTPFASKGSGKLVIKATAASKRPRQKKTK
ncbi:MAG: hypothetical protein IAG10_30865 [Planctomycetaceae bacterium]|nr:hypothetical protein [Planctomycetaceae bacterium]